MAILAHLFEGNLLHRYEISSENISIGRSIKNDIFLDDPSVSQSHVRIECKQLKDGAFIYFILDLQSTNHTYVNNQPITTQPLNDQDLIIIGTNTFKFIDPENESLAQTKAFKKSWFPGMYYLQD